MTIQPDSAILLIKVVVGLSYLSLCIAYFYYLHDWLKHRNDNHNGDDNPEWNGGVDPNGGVGQIPEWLYRLDQASEEKPKVSV